MIADPAARPALPAGAADREDPHPVSPRSETRRTVLLCDRVTLFREGLTRLLPRRGPFAVVAATDSVTAAIDEALLHHPDVILAGTDLADGVIADLAQRLVTTGCQSELVALCSDDRPCSSFGVPVDAAVKREAALDELIDALLPAGRTPARGVNPNPRPTMPRPCETAQASGLLAPRLICVLTLVARGWTNHDIAAWLGLREKTVRDYLTDAYRVLGVRSRTEAALAMLERGYGPEV